MLLLQSNDLYTEMAWLDTPAGELVKFSKEGKPDAEVGRINGHYSYIEGRLLALFCGEKGDVYVRIDSDIHKVEPTTSVKLEHEGKLRHLTVEAEGDSENTLHFTYHQITIPLYGKLDFFTQMELEDFDFGLFIHDVLNDPERRELYTKPKWLCDDANG